MTSLTTYFYYYYELQFILFLYVCSKPVKDVLTIAQAVVTSRCEESFGIFSTRRQELEEDVPAIAQLDVNSRCEEKLGIFS